MLLEIAYIRNLLFNRQFDQDAQDMLTLAHELSIKSDGPFVKLIDSCIKNCLEDIRVEDFQSAAKELNFIHNLPINFLELKSWNENFFYEFEISNYLDDNDNSVRIRNYISLLSEAQHRIKEFRKNHN